MRNAVRISTVLLALVGVSHAFQQKCKGDQLVVYRLIFETFWSRESFPKQYPEWRPPAQWSKLIGLSHDETFQLFRVGGNASEAFKDFAEGGKTEKLVGQSEDGSRVCDEFHSPSLGSGEGRTEVSFFVDGNHSMVSLAVRLVPSPDWFVGVDSLDLCGEGHWMESVIVEASPMDAGTENGFTFTSPHWPTEPQELIYKITSRYPKHPANSFYYPELDDLPPIAKFRFVKSLIYKQLSSTMVARSYTEPQKRRTIRSRCVVGQWSSWSECSAQCGEGVSVRTRSVTPLSKGSGHKCKDKRQERSCKHYKNCSSQLFKW